MENKDLEKYKEILRKSNSDETPEKTKKRFKKIISDGATGRKGPPEKKKK